jgi:hypothetical protein
MIRRNAWGIALMSIVLSWGLSVQAQQPSTPEQNQRQEEIKRKIFYEDLRDCKPNSMLRCWYIFWGAGDAPYRKLFFADLKVRTPTGDPNLVEIDVIEVHEGDSPKDQGANDYLLMTLQFRCQEQQFRVLDGYAFMFNGKIDRAPGATQWFPVPEAWYKLAGRIACDKEVQLRPLAHQMLWFGSQYRPIDVVDYTRRFLWEQVSTQGTAR